ncbi:hypothetical protein CU098_005515 [Rhizopus stolonifer]|uniref:Protein kinase domain-containing protein n=1 Tax=Rhizopus stolonifer TaxID=4846 RepID=A0A367KN19_RHIST|nr:hypothetical protein CU098_005515 [Rhizopus stolonifer]
MTCNQNEKMLQAQTLLYTTIDSQTMQLISILGIGAYGIVYLGQNILTGQNYAVKLLTHINVSRRETEIHAYLSGHPNILRFEKIVRENNKTFMIIEYTPEGDLFGAITQPGRGIVGNNDAIRHIFLQIIDAVQYCHQNNVFHRDLKPENIMLDSHWNVKLADFGLATTHQVSDEFGCGSTFYFSPECQGGTFRNHSRIKGYSTEKNDIWSLGVILINLVAGRNPWKQAHMRNATFAAYVRHPRHFFRKILPCISDELENILLRIFCLNPALRISLPELRFHILRCGSFIKPNLSSAHLKPPVSIRPFIQPKAPQMHCSESTAQTVLQYVACYTDEEDSYSALYNVPEKRPVQSGYSCLVSSDTSSVSSNNTSYCSTPGDSTSGKILYFNTQKLESYECPMNLHLYH